METPPLDQPPGYEGLAKPMPLVKALLINLGIMVCYLALSNLLVGTSTVKKNETELVALLVIDLVFVGLHAGLNFILGLALSFFGSYNHVGRALLICFLIVGVAGVMLSFLKLFAFG